MSTELSSQAVLEREFLPVRAKILEIAASLDRMQRAPGDVERDERLSKLHRAIEMLQSEDGDRAEQIQLLFSRPYERQWRESLDLAR